MRIKVFEFKKLKKLRKKKKKIKKLTKKTIKINAIKIKNAIIVKKTVEVS